MQNNMADYANAVLKKVAKGQRAMPKGFVPDAFLNLGKKMKERGKCEKGNN